MQASEAYAFAEQLGCIPEFPWGNPPAVAKVAEVIAQLCRDAAEARALVNAASESMAKWSGIPGLRAIHQSLRADEDQTWRGSYPCISPDCDRCRDLGWVNEGGRHIRCHCGAALKVSDEELQSLDRAFGKRADVNAFAKPQRPSAEEIQSVLARAIQTRGRVQ